MNWTIFFFHISTWIVLLSLIVYPYATAPLFAVYILGWSIYGSFRN